MRIRYRVNGVLVVNWKAVAEFFEKYRALSCSMSAATPAIMTAYPPQLESRILFVCLIWFYEFKRNDCFYMMRLM